MKTVGIIPARFGSSRLPGKPLLTICGKPMVWWVYQRARTIPELEEVYVATDDEHIADACERLGIPAVMTASTHRAAAHRLWEVSCRIEADFYLQINGDEPLIDAGAIKRAIPGEVPQDREFGTNIITPIHDPAEVLDSSNIKVVFNESFQALYLSRTPIPLPVKSLDFCYYKHVGIIGYNKKMLDFYASSSPGRLELIEGIDTLRFLDYGKELQLIPVDGIRTLSVDTEKDLEYVRRVMKERQL